MDVLIIIGLGVVAFLATNGDNLLLLLAFLANPTFKPRQVITGYCLAMSILLALAIGGALAGHLMPVEYLGLLGIIPLALGIKKLIDLFRKAPKLQAKTHSPTIRRSNTMTVALFELASGGDTVAVFAPLLAESKLGPATALCMTYVALVVAWCAAALYIWGHPKAARLLQRYARYVVPFLMIALGFYILYDTATDLL